MNEHEVRETLESGRIVRLRHISDGKSVFEEFVNEADTSWD